MRKDIIILLKQSIYMSVILGWVTLEKINQFPIYVRQQCIYIIEKYIIYLYELSKQVEKRVCGGAL